MDLDVEQLAAAVLRLPTGDRAALAARLLASLDEEEAERHAHEESWEAELDRRERDADRDPEGDVDASTALTAIRAAIGREDASA